MEPSSQSPARSRLARSRFVRDALVATVSLGFLYAVAPHGLVLLTLAALVADVLDLHGRLQAR